MTNTKKKTKNKIISGIVASVMLAGIIPFSACSTAEYSYDASLFPEFVESLQSAFFGDNCDYYNSFYVDSTSVGYERGEDVVASFYSYSKPNWFTRLATKITYEDLIAQLEGFNYDDLEESEQMEYDTIYYTLQSSLLGTKSAKYEYLELPNYVSSYGGYVANLESLVENYNYREKQDFEDVISYLKSSTDCFPTYTNYVKDLNKKKMPLYDYTLTSMQDYLNNIVESGNDYYLYAVLSDMVENATCLTTSEKLEYKERLSDALSNYFIPACQDLSSSLEKYKGKAKQDNLSYVANYGSKDYYNEKVSIMFGKDMTGESIYSVLQNAYTKYNNELAEFKTEYASYFEKGFDFSTSFVGLSTPQEMIDKTLEISKDVVPELSSDIEVSYKYMNENVAKISKALAYYSLSPLDEENSKEQITINGVQASDYGELFSTLAHEGYPGHLYDHVKGKENDVSDFAVIFGNLLLSEGWAQYASYRVLDTYSEQVENEEYKVDLKYQNYNTLTNYIYSGLLDIYNNYYGFTTETYERMGYSEEMAQYTIHYNMENPFNLLNYSYSFVYMLNSRDMAKASLGENYDEKDFNSYMLSMTDYSFANFENKVFDYVKQKLIEEYNKSQETETETETQE